MTGMIVRMDRSGLGYQTRNLAYMLKPDKIMLIDSTPFNHRVQHKEWYDGFSGIVVNGFPSNMEVKAFLRGLTHVVTCETPYNYAMYSFAKQWGIKIFTQHNYEFLDHLRDNHLATPYKFLSPSYWELEDMQVRFPGTVYLPPPIFPTDFMEARETNLERVGRRRFLHVVGCRAAEDRNGTNALLEALKHTSADFELVIKSQQPLGVEISDHRVRFDYTDAADQAELYWDFDALIYPRRYGGLALPMNEALMSALPVVMTDVNPNNRVLSPEWLVPAIKTGEFMGRTPIDVYNAHPVSLAARLDELCALTDSDLITWKLRALDIAMREYSTSALRDKWKEVLNG